MTLRYEVVPGNGLVARHADSILWVGEHTDPAAWEALGAVLRLKPGAQPTGADTAAALDGVQQALAQHPHTVFAALIVAGDQAQGLLRGPVTVRNQSEVAPASSHGELGITVPFAMSESVYVGYGQPLANPVLTRELLDLDGGVVPGGGAWVHPLSTGRRHASSGSGVHAQQENAEQPTFPETGEHVAAAQPLPAVGSAGSWASPVDAGAQAGRPAPPSGFIPAPDYERIDLRTATAQGSPEPLPITDASGGPGTAQPRSPSFGAIVLEDGSTFSLDRDYVVGRRPQKDPRVQSGQAAALTIVDPDTVLSSAHALLALRGGQVTLTDLGSLNGTHIAPVGAQEWTRLPQFQEVGIAPGTRLLFGWTVATYTGTE